MAILKEIGEYLEDQSVATVGTQLFLGRMPDAPNSCLAMYVTPGLISIKAFRSSPGSVAEQPRIQVLSRSKTYAGAMSASLLVYSALDGLGNTDMSGVTYLYIEALQPPFQLDLAEDKRVHIAQNFQVVKRVS